MLNGFEIIPINFVWVEPDELINKFKALFEEKGEAARWIVEKRPLDLKRVYLSAPPRGGAHLTRFAVWQPRNMSFGCVLIPNLRDGWIQLMRHLNKKFGVRYFAALLARDHKTEGFCTFEHRSESGERRNVYVIKDPRWKFFQEGRVLPFENPEYYRRRIIAERLTPQIIMEYLKSLGWDLESDIFWKSEHESWFAALLNHG